MATAVARLMEQPSPTADPQELAHFGAMASRWWDPGGDMRALHDINPLRTRWILDRIKLPARIADIGCGGGLLAEALNAGGAEVTAIDLAKPLIAVAKLHLHESGRTVDYRVMPAEQLAAEQPAQFDAVTCLEMLEHVEEPQAILKSCRDLLKPGGDLFLSTINRTTKAFALGIVAAEYVLGLVPRGSHRYDRFIKPSELARGLRELGFEVVSTHGIAYQPFLRTVRLSPDLGINYLLHARLPG